MTQVSNCEFFLVNDTGHAKKLQNMDDKAMMDLALELEGDDSKEKEEAAKKLQQKKKAKVHSNE